VEHQLRDKDQRSIIQLFHAALFALAGTIAFQWVNHALLPGTPQRQSHLADMIFYTLLATATSFFLFRREMIHEHKAGDGNPVKKLAGQPLEDVDNLLQGLVQASPLAVVALDPAGNVRLWSPAAEKLFGWKEEEVLGGPLPNLPPEEKADFLRTIRDYLKGEGRSHLELLRSRKDGSLVEVSMWSAPLRGDSGDVMGIMGLFEDITEINACKEALRKSEERFSLFMQHFPGMAYIQDPEGRYVYGSEAWFAQLPKRNSRLWREGTDDPWMPGEQLEDGGNDVALLTRRTSQQVVETAALGGTEVSMLISKFPILDKDGIPVLLGGVGINITEQRKMEEAASGYKKKLSSMAVAMSLAEEVERRRIASELHDGIGQTLALGKIKLDSLDCQTASAGCKKTLAEICGLMELSIQQVRSLTSQISPPLLYEVGLGVALEWLGERFNEDYGLAVTVTSELPTGSVSEGIRGTLFAIVRELLLNVVKHAEAKQVLVNIGTIDDRIKIEVEDDGKGFDPAQIHGREVKGSGFGLFNIRQKIAYLNGDFFVDSSMGGGTRVTILAPVSC
jgi:two-component system, NarL family, sensor histidine kinase UhpB